MNRQFRDRTEAGKLLAGLLQNYADRKDVTVLALPRGGVPVAFEVADRLHAPLDVFVVRKLGLPGHEELAMGAIASGGVRALNEDVIIGLGIPRPVIDRVAAREQRELDRRERLYRGSRPPAKIAGRLVILVDDGIATGSTMRAAVIALKQQKPARVIVAVPTAPASSYEEFQELADEIVVERIPENFYAIGQFYEDFSQTTDEQVQELLAKAAQTCATVSP